MAWFAERTTSLKGPNYGIKSVQIYPEHPRILFTRGQKPTTGQLSGFAYNKQPHRKNICSNKTGNI